MDVCDLEIEHDPETLIVDGEECYLSELGIDITQEGRLVQVGKVAIVGGLTREQDPENPLELCEVEGQIIHEREKPSEYWSAFGYDPSKKEPCYSDSSVQEILVKKVVDWMVGRNEALLRDLLVYSEKEVEVLRCRSGESRMDAFRRALFDTIGDRLEVSDLEDFFGGDEFAEEALDLFDMTECRIKQMTEEAFAEARCQGRLGNPLAVALGISGYYSYTASIEGGCIQAEPCEGDAIWIPSKVAMEEIEARVLREFPAVKGVERIQKLVSTACDYARSSVDTWNQWQDGNVFGVQVWCVDLETADILEHDSAWGYVGESHAREGLEEAFNSEVRRVLTHQADANRQAA